MELELVNLGFLLFYLLYPQSQLNLRLIYDKNIITRFRSNVN